jgi:hypothetical protein
MATKKTKKISASTKKYNAVKKAKATLAKKAKHSRPLGASTCGKAGHDLVVHRTSTAGRKLRTCK